MPVIAQTKPLYAHIDYRTSEPSVFCQPIYDENLHPHLNLLPEGEEAQDWTSQVRISPIGSEDIIDIDKMV